MSEGQQLLRQRFTHALLSPLTVVLGSAEVLQNSSEDWPAYARELLDLILTQGRRLQQTLDALVASAEVEGDVVRVCWTVPPAQPAEGAPDPIEPTDPGPV